jgi:protease-4
MHYPPPPPPRRGSLLTSIVAVAIIALLVLSLFFNFISLIAFAATTHGHRETTYSAGDSAARIVILPVRGMIDDSMSTFVRESLAELRDDLPKAVILRVDSGGGTVAASDRIAHELELFHTQTKVPIVASFGSMAASGGYYIAAGADHIIAEPTTLTGSIGVIAEAFTVPQLLEKIGVTSEVVTSTPATKKDMLNPFRAWTDTDRTMLRAILDNAHARFVTTVYEGRKSKQLTREQVAELATGEVFTADAAEKNHLIDEQGFMAEAVTKASQLAQIDPKITPQVTVVQPAKALNFLSLLGASAPPSLGSVESEQLRRWAAELSVPSLRYQSGF